MNRAQLIVDLKNMIGPGPEVDNDGLSTWINDAYMYICDEISKRNPDFFTKAVTTTVYSGQQEYTLPTDFEKMLMANIKYSGTWRKLNMLPNATDINALADTSNNQGFSAADPYGYVLGSRLGIMPIPSDSVADGLKIWYVYTPSELSTDSLSPAFPSKYHHIIKFGALANYMNQDNQHGAAEAMRNRFEDRVRQMMESMFENSVDALNSITVSSGGDLYTDIYV